MKLTRIGIDIAKQVFQLRGTDRIERTVWRRRLPRDRWLQAVREVAEPEKRDGGS
jgi:transposase